MTGEVDITKAAAWRVLDQITGEARQTVVRQRLTEDQLDALIEESLSWARSSEKTAAQDALGKPKMPPVFPTGTSGNPA